MRPALLSNPSEIQRLAADPTRVQAILEETLRFDSPVQYVARVATQDVEIRGQRISKGEEIVAFLGSANRDERRFSDPDHFDPDRDTRGHMGFGHGAHFCLGASLARLEANMALSALAPELPHLSRVTAEPEMALNNAARGRSRLALQRSTQPTRPLDATSRDQGIERNPRSAAHPRS